MRLVDTNVLVYAVDTRSPFHNASRRWLDHALAGGEPVGFVWQALVGFVRIVTRAPFVATPMTVGEAMDQVDSWLGARSAHLLHPGPHHATLLRGILQAVGTGGNLTNDAHLAALAIEHKATIVSFDADFARFPGVRWERPR